MKIVFIRTFFLLQFLGWCLSGIGQEVSNVDRKWAVGLNYSLNRSFRSLQYDEFYQPIVAYREAYEVPAYGYNIGLNARFQPFQRLEFEFGAQLLCQAVRSKGIPFIDPMFGVWATVDNRDRYFFLSIPLRVNVQLLTKRFFIYLTVGVSYDLFLSSDVISTVTFNDGTREVTKTKDGDSNFTSGGWGILGGCGAGYKLTERFDFRLEPLVRYSLFPLVDAPIEQRNYSAGAQLSISWKL